VPRLPRSKAVAAAAVAVALVAAGGSAAVTTPPIVAAIAKTAKIVTTPKKGVTASGTIKCTKGHHYRVVADLVEKAGGAFASGSYPPPHTQKTCSGPTTANTWTMLLETKSGTVKAGSAQVCVLASTSYKKTGATGIAESCNVVTLAVPK
jgi:hypothetical protein